MYYVRVEGSWLQFPTLVEAETNKMQALISGQSAEIFISLPDHERTVHDAVTYHTAQLCGTTPQVTALDEAKSVIYGDREKTYGHPAKNLEAIADFWSSYLENYYGEQLRPLTGQDVAQMMILLKIARLQNQPKHRDSRVDIIGYAALVDRMISGN